MSYEPWTLIDAGRESLWGPSIWLGVLELIGRHEGQSVYDRNAPIYDDLEKLFPKENWRAEDRGRFRPLFRDYSKPWTSLGLASFDGIFRLLDNGMRLLRDRGGARIELARLLRDYEEDGCFPFRLLAEAIRSSPNGASFEFLYHDISCRCRSEQDIRDALSSPSAGERDIPDTPKRRLKLMLRILERTGAVQSCNDGFLWVYWDAGAVNVILDPRVNVNHDAPTDLRLPLCTSLNEIVEGVPGTGKSHLISQLGPRFERTRVIVMHPAMSYEDLVEGVRPIAALSMAEGLLQPKPTGTPYFESYSDGVASGTALVGNGSFGIRGGLLLLACAEACRQPGKRFLLVLDELNRCNVPRALGELLLCLEPSKRWCWCDESQSWKGEVSVQLPYSGLQFFVPNNLHVLGTLNSSDKSTSALDQAVRRRFSFYRLEPLPEAELLNNLGPSGVHFAKSIQAWSQVNRVLQEECGPDAVLGHSYFFESTELARGPLGVEGATRRLWLSTLLPQVVDILSANGRLDLIDGSLRSAWDTHLASIGLRVKVWGTGSARAARIESLLA